MQSNISCSVNGFLGGACLDGSNQDVMAYTHGEEDPNSLHILSKEKII